MTENGDCTTKETAFAGGTKFGLRWCEIHVLRVRFLCGNPRLVAFQIGNEAFLNRHSLFENRSLKDFEIGHVKEGVGAGGISMLAFLNGFKNHEIVSLCQQNLEKMKGLGQISLEKDC